MHRLTSICVAGLRQSNINVINTTWFDTIVVQVNSSREIHQRALKHNILLRDIDDKSVGISFDETSNSELVKVLFDVFQVDVDIAALDQSCILGITQAMRRSDEFLTQATFSKYRTEHEMLRYLRRLADKDLALDRTMIPLGSCTMKLNATTEMIPVTWPEFANIHPFAPASDIAGYTQ